MLPPDEALCMENCYTRRMQASLLFMRSQSKMLNEMHRQRDLGYFRFVKNLGEHVQMQNASAQ